MTIDTIIQTVKTEAPHVYNECEFWGHKFYRVGWNASHEFFVGRVQTLVIYLREEMGYEPS